MPTCRTCGKPIIWAKTTKGKTMPLDAEPVEHGTYEVDANGVAHHVGATFFGEAKRYTSHFATCPQAAEHRKKQGPA